MTTDYQAFTNDLTSILSKLNQEIPDVMDGFHKLAAAASVQKALDKKTKELVALGIGITSHCKGCIGFHVKALIRLGVTKEE